MVMIFLCHCLMFFLTDPFPQTAKSTLHTRCPLFISVTIYFSFSFNLQQGKELVMDEEDTSAVTKTVMDTTTTTTTTTSTSAKKLTLIPLIFLIYFEVAGGPYGEEPAVQAAGPLLAILGFLIFPFIWSIPEALITAELTTAFPGNGGFVIWAERAFGPFWGSLMGTWKFLSGVINIASFPVLCIDYVKKVFPVFGSGWPRYVAILGSTLALSFLNYTGLTIVGYAAVVLAVVSLSPFILMSLIAIPKIHPHRWLSLGQKGVKKDWNLFFNTLFWNLNFWDNSAWETGFHAQAAEMIAGKWLKIWIEFGAVLSAIGLFEAQLSSSAYQVLGMADIGILPKFFGIRSKWFNTPWLGILVSTLITIAVSYMNFTDIISSANFLYSLGMLLEFASFLWLRWKSPLIKRPYRIPMKLPLLVVMCLIPSGFLIFIMVIATKTVYLVSGVMTVGGIGCFFFIKLCKAKNWAEFSISEAEEDGIENGVL
ncbi:probable polyamine transporter At3g13620 [Gastrolobium bilobum]|uniref:probable polyamine transporter At3g13620 n=1 Tax=Gastrolobium bilobum TaxID=150636 RepID=UPI002AAF9588|nr:probable polyamine transporter At3g13620 [Gastrolobium bilobum]